VARVSFLPPFEQRVEDGVHVLEAVLDERWEGPVGHAHGGVTAALFDQVLGDAVTDVVPGAMTARLCVDFRRPWPLGVRGTFRGTTERVSERKLDAAAELRAPDGTLLAEARGLWVVPRTGPHPAARSTRRAVSS
jgi:uncharacterized protein (TIGR00369 family)